MARLPEITPLGQVWPIRPDEHKEQRKPETQHQPKARPAKRREPAPRDDDDETGHFDEYA